MLSKTCELLHMLLAFFNIKVYAILARRLFLLFCVFISLVPCFDARTKASHPSFSNSFSMFIDVT